MVDAASFLTELEGRNEESLRRLTTAYAAVVSQENLTVADLLKLEMKAVIEAGEVAALWIPDSDSLSLKLALAGRCGDEARHFSLLAERLGALGCAAESFDPQHGGYTKLFAFLRSLQTTEERAAAGFLTHGRMFVTRLEALAELCEAKDDAESARLLRGTLAEDESRHAAVGRQTLLATAHQEESQARARRSAYRTLELAAEVQEAGQLRKFLSRSLRKG